MMGRAGIAYTTGFMAIATALPYMLGMFIFSGYAGRIQQVGEKYHIESIPSLFEYRFGKPAKCVLAAMVASPWWARWPPRSPPPLPLLSCWGDRWASATRWGLHRHRHLHHLYRRLRTVRRGVHRRGAVFHAHYLCLPDDPISSLDYLGASGASGPAWTRATSPLPLTARYWGTSSPIWCSPWRGRRCGSGPLRPRIKNQPSGACSGAPPSMA